MPVDTKPHIYYKNKKGKAVLLRVRGQTEGVGRQWATGAPRDTVSSVATERGEPGLGSTTDVRVYTVRA